MEQLRIGIVGAGLSGLGLGAVLAKELDADITVFERADQNRDEGYGLDLDENGMRVLRRAGQFHSFWSISRPYSDVMTWTTLRGLAVIFIKFYPAWLRWLLSKRRGSAEAHPEPESNRAELRELFLATLRDAKASVRFNVKAARVEAAGGAAKLLDAEGASLGTFHLVVDASGVHSPLRLQRVHDSEGVHSHGYCLLHGVIDNPDSSLPPDVLALLGQGSLIASGFGTHEMKRFMLQRFGSKPEDQRTAFFYSADVESETELLKAIGLDPIKSRQDGILRGERLQKVQDWMHRDMGEEYDPRLHRVVDCLDRVTVRAAVTHGPTTLRDDDSLPLVCIGDALRNIGVGGGGQLAFNDVNELADELVKNRRVDLPALRLVEAAMLKRRVDFTETRDKRMKFFKGDASKDISMAGMVRDMGYRKTAWFVPAMIYLWHALFRLERRWRGKIGNAEY